MAISEDYSTCNDNYLCSVIEIAEAVIEFDSELNFIKQFGSGELRHPGDIRIISDIILILPQSDNCIYCYYIYCTLQKKIQLTGQDHLMTVALFFTINKKGNFLIADHINYQIRIFSSKGVLTHILGTGHLPYVSGITLDNFGKSFVRVLAKKDVSWNSKSQLMFIIKTLFTFVFFMYITVQCFPTWCPCCSNLEVLQISVVHQILQLYHDSVGHHKISSFKIALEINNLLGF